MTDHFISHEETAEIADNLHILNKAFRRIETEQGVQSKRLRLLGERLVRVEKAQARIEATPETEKG